MKIVKDTKKSIRRLQRAEGLKNEKESREALEDPDASEYMKFVVSGDEDSDATVLGDEEGEEEPWVDVEGQGGGAGGGGGEDTVVGGKEGVDGERTLQVGDSGEDTVGVDGGCTGGDGGEQDGDTTSTGYHTAGEAIGE